MSAASNKTTTPSSTTPNLNAPSKSTTVAKTPKLETELTQVKGGMPNLPSSITAIPINGQTLTPAQVTTQIDACLAKYTATDSAKVAYVNALADRKTIDAEAEAIVKGVWALVKLLFPNDLAMQAAFGIDAKSKAKPSALTKAAAVAKSNATKQKKKPAPTPPEVQLVDSSGNVIGPAPATAPSANADPAPSAPTSAAPAPSGK